MIANIHLYEVKLILCLHTKRKKITSETFRASFYIYALRYIFRGMEKKNLVLMFSMLMCK